MDLVLISFASLTGSYLILRNICLSTARKEQTPTMITLAGMASWLFILLAAGWILLAFYLVFALLVLGSLAAVYGLIFIGLCSGFAFQFNEVLDAGAVFYYIRDTALFRPMRPKTMLVQEELDKQKIRAIHRETSGKPFPTAPPKKQLLSEKDIQQIQRELHMRGQRPSRSDRFDEELKNLKSGTVTSIADPWKVYTFSHKFHDWYAEMSHVEIDPATRTLRFQLNVADASAIALRDPLYVFRLKQELYQLFQVLNTDPWLAWYNDFAESFQVTIYGIASDSFGHTQLFPFMRVSIQRSSLSEREGRFFNAADLHTISSIMFNNGQPLADET
jgi:hypothetical protein